MSDILKVDPDGLHGWGSLLGARAEALGLRLTLLRDSSTRLVDSEWSGEASDSYRVRQGGWTTVMEHRHADLVSYVALLERVIDRYEKAESKVIRLCE